jgi:effector-binding domain-containing protein
MKKIICFVCAALFYCATAAVAREEASYTVVTSVDNFEIRDYQPHLVAETVVGGTLAGAGSKAFRKLHEYLDGENRQRCGVTTPETTVQKPGGVKIEMALPVEQQRVTDGWSVGLTMPAAYTAETLPVPLSPKITIRQVPARRMASIRYSGYWNEKNYQKSRQELESWIREKGQVITGEPVWARYDRHFSPASDRRNEVLIPIAAEAGKGNHL